MCYFLWFLLYSEKVIGGCVLGWSMDLYYFNDNSSSNKQTQCFSSLGFLLVYEWIRLWHFRLGNPSFQYLIYLFPILFKCVDRCHINLLVVILFYKMTFMPLCFLWIFSNIFGKLLYNSETWKTGESFRIQTWSKHIRIENKLIYMNNNF